jgi:hypothetical protein
MSGRLAELRRRFRNLNGSNKAAAKPAPPKAKAKPAAPSKR